MLSVALGLGLALVLAALGLRLAFFRAARLPRSKSQSLPASNDTALGAAAAAVPCDGNGHSGLIGLRDGLEAFATRIHLIRAAEVSLDLQYYLWQPDIAGYVVLDELRRAAERGVRIRVLVDDIGAPELDGAFAALNTLPGVELRIFNPFVLRRVRLINLLLDFGRLNRRMHNKSLTADGAVCVIGGRNIGDAYFQGDAQRHFIDFDVLAAGPAAADVGADFDCYWACSVAIPAEAMLRTPADGLHRLTTEAARLRATAEAEPYLQALEDSSAASDLLSGCAQFHCAPVRLISDPPEKAAGRAERRQLLINRLDALLSRARKEALLVSAYFIPGQTGLRAIEALLRRGVRLRVLTNGQQSTDVTMVHCGYARYRHRLLAAGVTLYELKAGEGLRKPTFGARHRRRRRGLPGSSGTSLHSKTLVLDGRTLFVGSFNLDPRSKFLNTEMGFLIDSPGLASEVSAAIREDMADVAYELRLSARGHLQWVDPGMEGSEVLHRAEPGTTWASRALVRLLGLLPIEWLL